MSYIIPAGVSTWLFWLMVAVTVLSVAAAVVIWLNLKGVRAGVTNFKLTPRNRNEYKVGAAFGARAFDGAVGATLVSVIHMVSLYAAPSSVIELITRWLVIAPAVWCIYNLGRMQYALSQAHNRW